MALSSSDIGIKCALQALEAQGFDFQDQIGHATFAVVYDMVDRPGVVKLTTDVGAYHYMTQFDECPEELLHLLPAVYEDLGVVGWSDRGYTIYGVWMEYLVEVCDGVLWEETEYGDREYSDTYEDCVDLANRVAYWITERLGLRATEDVHEHNVMLRDCTGTVVLSDPVATFDGLRPIDGRGYW